MIMDKPQQHIPVEIVKTLLGEAMHPNHAEALQVKSLQGIFHQYLETAMAETEACDRRELGNGPITLDNIDTYFDLSDMEREMIELARSLDTNFQGRISLITDALTIISVVTRSNNGILFPQLGAFWQKTLLEIAGMSEQEYFDDIYIPIPTLKQTIKKIQREAVILVINARKAGTRLETIPDDFLEQIINITYKLDGISSALRLFIAKAAKDGSIKAFTTDRFRNF